ncbi:hypothetical protein DYB37_013188 [Aphanomyces astaci]|uniref:FYVE-type domain-containing protein n=1 Tax=Aphanomyces astaci TaxID=112090 RepID=A0A3R6XKA0_APHAT|nr:hypothetical protein DYB35_011592 [Aphanomyces astaci]RHZ33744.1 hypothetical protein DYB37_013188 [Aphanomyces astaci]
MPLKLPLPAGFFERPALNEYDIQRVIREATCSAMSVVHKTQLVGGPIAWSLRSDEVDVKIYKGSPVDDKSDGVAASGAVVYMSVTEVVGTLDEVVELFQTRTTKQAKHFATRFGHQLKDAIKLYSLVEPTADAPMELVDLTWRAYKSPMSLIVAERDACLLECNHAFTCDNGQRGWVVSVQSIELPCCPDLEALGGLVRMMNYGSGHVFLESMDRPGWLEIRYVAHVDFRGIAFDFLTKALAKRNRSWLTQLNINEMASRRRWVSDIHMTKRCRNITDIDRFLREDRVFSDELLQRMDTRFLSKASLAAATACHLCHVEFSWKHRKTNCAKCGHVLCKSCNPWWATTKDSTTKQVRACVICALGRSTHHYRRSSTASQISLPRGSRGGYKAHEDMTEDSSDDGSATYTSHFPLMESSHYSRTSIVLDDYSEYRSVKTVDG